MKVNWKTLGLIATIAGGVLSIAAGIIDDKKRSDEIQEAVHNEFDRRIGEGS